MGVEKECLSEDEIKSVIRAASILGEETRRIILILLYTGMHISVLCNPQKVKKEHKRTGSPYHDYGLKIVKERKKKYFQWKRPKKTGKDAIVKLLVVDEIDFSDDLSNFINKLKRRKRKSNRVYYWRLIKKVGKVAGMPKISSMTLRHTFGLILADKGFPESFIIQKMNCSRENLQRYLKYSTKRSDDLMDRLWKPK